MSLQIKNVCSKELGELGQSLRGCVNTEVNKRIKERLASAHSSSFLQQSQEVLPGAASPAYIHIITTPASPGEEAGVCAAGGHTPFIKILKTTPAWRKLRL